VCSHCECDEETVWNELHMQARQGKITALTGGHIRTTNFIVTCHYSRDSQIIPSTWKPPQNSRHQRLVCCQFCAQDPQIFCATV